MRIRTLRFVHPNSQVCILSRMTLTMKPIHCLQLFLAATLCLAVAKAQSPTDPPPGQHAILTVTGKGVQIYACQMVANAPQWVFDSPDASLFDASGAKVGVHGSGPSWRYYDGSTAKGEVLAKSTAPESGAIPWLLLKAVSDDNSGILARAEFIRRSETHGGMAPTAGCDAKHLNAVSRTPYTATYTFYSAAPEPKE
jgi:Protein of unknown function (DUF3455)